MRIHALVLLAICVCAEVASAQATMPSTGAANPVSANKELARQFYEPFTTGNVTVLTNIMAANWEDIPLAPGQKGGRDGLTPIIQQLRGTFAKLSIVSQDLIAEGDKVTVRTVWSGTHAGDFFGLKPSGKPIANGRIIRTWHLEDLMGVYAQLGGLDPKR